jgi:uncharacterized protein YjiS (DUF1127 family)
MTQGFESLAGEWGGARGEWMNLARRRRALRQLTRHEELCNR